MLTLIIKEKYVRKINENYSYEKNDINTVSLKKSQISNKNAPLSQA